VGLVLVQRACGFYNPHVKGQELSRALEPMETPGRFEKPMDSNIPPQAMAAGTRARACHGAV
jgi:hypothetical protein